MSSPRWPQRKYLKHIQKEIRKESEQFTTKEKRNTKEGSNGGNEEQKV